MLYLHLGVPEESVAARATIIVTLNGRELARILATADSIERELVVIPTTAGQPNVLELAIDRTIPPANGTPEQGVRLRSLGWGPG